MVRVTIAAGNDKPPAIPPGKVTRCVASYLASARTRSEENAGDIRVSRRTLGRIERYNAGQGTRVLRVMDH